MKKFLISTIEKIHLKIFGHKMSDQMRAFLGNLSWSFYGGVLSMPVTIVIGTLAGRFMGPEQYGKYNLILLISNYIISVEFFGLDISTVKHVAKAKTLEKKQASFFSSFIFTTITTSIFLIIILIFRKKISSYLNLDLTVLNMVIIYTAIVTVRLMLDIMSRALEKFKLQAGARLAEILILAGGFFLVLILFKKMNFVQFTAIVLAGAVVVSLIYLINFKNYFRNFSLKTLKTQLAEGKFFMLSAVLGTIFLSSDRLLIAKYIDVRTLGIYSAYYSASLALVAGLSVILTNVLLPATAKTDDKSFIYKIDTLCIKSFAPIYLLICSAIFIFLKLFGKAYPLKLSYLLLFAFISTLYFFQTVYNIVILDASRRRYFQYFLISNLINLANIAYYFILMRYISKSIDLVLIGFAVNTVLTLIVQLVITRKIIKEANPNQILNN